MLTKHFRSELFDDSGYLGDELSYRLPVCAFVYRVRDCKHPVPAIYINDNNLQVRYYIFGETNFTYEHKSYAAVCY